MGAERERIEAHKCRREHLKFDLQGDFAYSSLLSPPPLR